MCLFGADGLDGRSKGVLCVCCCDGGAVHRVFPELVQKYILEKVKRGEMKV